MLYTSEQNRMGKEKFHAPRGSLSFSTELVSLTLHPGEKQEGSFTVYAHASDSVSGFVLSSSLAMKCLTPEFSGTKEVISFEFDASAYQTGNTVEGYFRILSNEGEYKLPFQVKVMPVLVQSTLGPVRNLFHFTNLAKTNWKEAVAAFYNPAFEGIFSALETKEKTLWRGLAAHPGNQQNVEEYLISIGKKTAVEFLPKIKEVNLELPIPEKAPVEETLEIGRNGWGFTKLEAAVEGSFLRPSKSLLTAMDFREGSCSFSYTIDPAGLHQGLNLGALIFKGPFSEIRIPVSVKYCVSTALRTIRRKQRDQTILRMTRDYEEFRAKRMTGREYLQKTASHIRELEESDRDSIYTTLYRIHYLLTAGKNDEAKFELTSCSQKLSGGVEDLPPYSIAKFPEEDDMSYSYRMYLTILCADASGDDPVVVSDAIDGAEHMIQDMLKRNPDNFWIAWLYMYASGDIESRPQSCMQMLKEQYTYGCTSPVLFLEAFSLVRTNPAILHELGPFETQTLCYAARHGQLDDAVMTQVNYLAQREKHFGNKLFHVLAAAYEAEKADTVRDETLSSICALLIRGNLTDPKYFPWYQKGVDRQLSITRLFDYYMLSMPADYAGEIPQMIILYFAFQSSLPYEKNACLYRYILEHRSSLSHVYGQYETQIRSFTEDNLLQHRISHDLSVLYEARIHDAAHPLTGELAGACVPTVFTCEVRTEDPKAGRIVLLYDACTTEQYFPVTNGIAYVPVYGEGARFLFEDDAGNRYAADVSYRESRMMNWKEDARILSSFETNNFYYDLYLAGKRDDWFAITKENASHYRNLCEAPELEENLRQQMRLYLLHFYHDSDDVPAMDDFLEKIGPKGLSPEARGEIIGYMVIRGNNDKALAWLREYGAFHVDGAVLMKLLSAVLQEKQTGEDPVFSGLVYECFRKGKYDEPTLLYLCQYFDGLSEELEEIREAAVNFGLDDEALVKRMLIQILYTGHVTEKRSELMQRYLKSDPDSDLVADCLAQSAHFYFVKDLPMGREEFDAITEYGREGVPLVDICRIAWLKDRAEHASEMTDAQREVTGLFLGDLMQEGILFPFFRQFVSVCPQLQAYADETLVSYRTKDPEKDVKIVYHYAMEKDGARQQYRARKMKEMYEGVYVTGFLLFFGEQLHYYITNDEEEKNVVESGTLGQDARITEDEEDRFGMINRISMLTALGRDEEALDRIENYTHRAFLEKRMFGTGGDGGNAN